MRDSLYLAWRYMRHHKLKTAILVGSVTLILYLPLALQVLVDRTAEQLSARARSTPLIVGARGSAVELALSTLYFESKSPAPIRMAEVERIRATGLAAPIPMHVRFRVRNQRIVGTTLDYFDFRGLRVGRGRPLAKLGECVLGAAAAAALQAGPGDTVNSSPEALFDLAGVYPLRMRVVGVLERTHGPDDEAVFVDIKTAWIIEGLGHGHQDLAGVGAEGRVLERKDGRIVANASVVQYTEITAENEDSFHFHGDRSGFPLTAILAVPPDDKSKTLLLGRYLGRDETSQALEPVAVMEELVGTVARVRSWVIAAVVLVTLATALTMVLVFWLSLRLRRRELETMARIGCSRRTVASLVVCEIAVVFAFSAVLAAALTGVTSLYGPSLIRGLIL